MPRYRSPRCTTSSTRSNAGYAGNSPPSNASSATPSRGASPELFIRAQSLYIRPIMRTEEPRTIRLQDYRPPDWLIETVELDVSLDAKATTVRAKLKIAPNPAGAPAPLV